MRSRVTTDSKFTTHIVFSMSGSLGLPLQNVPDVPDVPNVPDIRGRPALEAPKDHPPKGHRERSQIRKLKRNSSKIQARKRHININLFCPVGLGTTPGLSRGFHRVCPWGKSGQNLGHTRVLSLFYTVEARFHRVCHRHNPVRDKNLHRGFCASGTRI